MKLTESTLAKARELNDPAVNDLLQFYEFVVNNQVYESYVARMVTLNKWNEDLSENPVSIISTRKLTVADSGIDEKVETKLDKEVDRVLKFLEKQPDLIKGTDELRAILIPSEKDKLKSEKRLSSSKDIPL